LIELTEAVREQNVRLFPRRARQMNRTALQEVSKSAEIAVSFL